MRWFTMIALTAALAWGQAPPPLRLEKTIPLKNVRGRIDHMSLDTVGRRLFVSALGNNTVEVINLRTGARVKSITGLAAPQGVLYVPGENRLYVANDGDGSVRIFNARTYAPVKRLDYGDDADNLRVAGDTVVVGYGAGGLGAINRRGDKAGGIYLDSHPESFQLNASGTRLYLNLPAAGKVLVIAPKRWTVLSAWDLAGASANYPMALDEADQRLFVATRRPARLLIFDTRSGTMVQQLPVVGDCDDLFFDVRRRQVYAIGGAGAIAVYQQQGDQYREIGQVATAPGARTGLFSGPLDRLFVAVRQQGNQAAAIRIYVP